MIGRKFVILALATGLTAAAATADAATRVQKTFDQWRVDCTETEKAKFCGLIFALLHAKTKQVMFAWSIVPAKEGSGGNRAMIRAPNGILLSEGLLVEFAGTDPVKLAYKTCGPRNCIVEVDFSESWLKAFNSHPSFAATYVAVNGTPTRHEISLKQFKEAYGFYTAQREQRTGQ
jgi:invasion protein IalB